MKNDWKYSPEMVKLPVITKTIDKKNRLKKINHVFVIFKHCETKHYVDKFLKDHR